VCNFLIFLLNTILGFDRSGCGIMVC
jgi:hypothetical protein